MFGKLCSSGGFRCLAVDQAPCRKGGPALVSGKSSRSKHESTLMYSKTPGTGTSSIIHILFPNKLIIILPESLIRISQERRNIM